MKNVLRYLYYNSFWLDSIMLVIQLIEKCMKILERERWVSSSLPARNRIFAGVLFKLGGLTVVDRGLGPFVIDLGRNPKCQR